MGQLGRFLRKQHGGYAHWCPGCECVHHIPVEEPHPNGSQWRFDGNLEAPTFTPSVNYVGCCHYFITAGKIQFCADSQHGLAGKTVDLPELPAELRD